MYKDLGTVLLIGGCGTGKSVFIHKYIKEIINWCLFLLYTIVYRVSKFKN